MGFIIMLVYLLFAGITVYLSAIEKIRLAQFFLVIAVLLFVPWLFEEQRRLDNG